MATCKDCLHVEVCRQHCCEQQNEGCCSCMFNACVYEDKAEECPNFKYGDRFIELPCNIGDKIYVIHRAKDGNGHIQPLICSALHLRDEINRRRIKKKYEYVVAKHDGYCAAHLDLTKLGIDWFVNYEAAKKALEEWREEVKRKK